MFPWAFLDITIGIMVYERCVFHGDSNESNILAQDEEQRHH